MKNIYTLIPLLLLTSVLAFAQNVALSPSSNAGTNGMGRPWSNEIGVLTVNKFSDANSLTLILPPEVLLASNAIVKLKEAAEKEHNIHAATNLGDYYMLFDYNITKQIKYFQIAAERGDVRAAYNLAFIYNNDQGFVDKAKAKYWLSLAAASGYADAKSKLMELEK